MKLTMVGTFDLEDMQEIKNFIEIQTTTDRERENTTIILDSVEVKVVIKYDAIEKLIFRKVRK